MPRDLNQLASKLTKIATGEEEKPDENEGKNPAAVALGRLGGKKGGKARAEKLTPKQRKKIAKKVVASRWDNQNSSSSISSSDPISSYTDGICSSSRSSSKL